MLEDARGCQCGSSPSAEHHVGAGMGVPGMCPGEAAGPEGRRGGQAGSGPPLQTLTLFSQVRRQFPWKQPGAETGTRIQKCEALSSSSPSWIPAPRDPGWVLAPTLLPLCVGAQGCPAWAPPGLGCSSVCARCSILGMACGMGTVSSRAVQGVPWDGTLRAGTLLPRTVLAAPRTDTFKQRLCVKVLHRGGWDVRAHVLLHAHLLYRCREGLGTVCIDMRSLRSWLAREGPGLRLLTCPGVSIPRVQRGPHSLERGSASCHCMWRPGCCPGSGCMCTSRGQPCAASCVWEPPALFWASPAEVEPLGTRLCPAESSSEPCAVLCPSVRPVPRPSHPCHAMQIYPAPSLLRTGRLQSLRCAVTWPIPF